MRYAFLGFALLTTACFHWAPVESLGEIEDDRVRIYEPERAPIAMEHATAHGRVLEGLVDGEVVTRIDVSGDHVMARRLNPGGTAAIVAIAVLATAATTFAIAFAILAQPHEVPFQGGF